MEQGTEQWNPLVPPGPCGFCGAPNPVATSDHYLTSEDFDAPTPPCDHCMTYVAHRHRLLVHLRRLAIPADVETPRIRAGTAEDAAWIDRMERLDLERRLDERELAERMQRYGATRRDRRDGWAELVVEVARSRRALSRVAINAAIRAVFRDPDRRPDRVEIIEVADHLGVDRKTVSPANQPDRWRVYAARVLREDSLA